MKTKWDSVEATIVAQDVIRELTKACAKIDFVGHLRHKPNRNIEKVEIILVPIAEVRRTGIFGHMAVSLAEEKLAWLLRLGYFTKRPNHLGQLCWGEINKSAVHKNTGMPVDIKVVTAATFDELTKCSA